MSKDEVLDYMSQLESEDKSLAEFSEKYSELALFLADYDFLKDKNRLSQKEIAKKMGTTQSAVSRIERFKMNPSYLQLKKMAEAVGGKLFLSPMGEYSITLPADLQESVQVAAHIKNISLQAYLENCIRNALRADYKDLDVESDDEYFCPTTYNQRSRNFQKEMNEEMYSDYENDIYAA